MRLLYDLVLFFYHNGIRLAAFFKPKAQKWVAGRKQLIQQLPPANKGKKRIWMHCASLGEFEQGRPLLEALRQQYPEKEILLTFYSPSGYELRKNYAVADFVHYLPADTGNNARRFLQICQPDIAIFVKYEFWYHYLSQLQESKIPTLLIAAQFRPGQIFFRPYGGFFRKMLHQFDQIFVQEQRSAQLLDNIGIQQYQVGGDPRVDRVQQIAAQKQHLPIIQSFCDGHPILIAGSTWPADESIIVPFLKDQLPDHWKIIIAPHEIHPQQLKQLQEQLPFPNQLYSEAQKKSKSTTRALIIDNIGMLSSIYQYGQIAYIGGGFGKGIHNTLEAAVFGLPLIFGPKYQAFPEAIALIEEKGAFSVTDSKMLGDVFLQLQSAPFYQKAQNQAKAYISNHSGATLQIIDYIEPIIKSF